MRLTKDFLLSFIAEASRFKTFTPTNPETERRLDVFKAARGGAKLNTIPGVNPMSSPSLERAYMAGHRGFRGDSFEVGDFGGRLRSMAAFRASAGAAPRTPGRDLNPRTLPPELPRQLGRIRSQAGHRGDAEQQLSRLPKT